MGNELSDPSKQPPKPMSLSPMMAHAVSVSEIKARKASVHQLLTDVFVKDVHFGVIPGTGTKPSLLQPGAQDIMAMFQLRPSFRHEDVWHQNGHYTRSVKCVLIHYPTGMEIGEGNGVCSSMEKKYRWRNADRKCPKCQAPTIMTSKFEPGFYCYAKKGGCGATFGPDDKTITEQVLGVIENPDIADMYNTVCKIGDKRALVAAILNATGASDTFTQDVEDMQMDYVAAQQAQGRVKEIEAHFTQPATPAPAPAKPQPQPQPQQAKPAADLPEDAPQGNGSNMFLTAEMMDALKAVMAKYSLPLKGLGTLIFNATGQKPKSSGTITRAQYNTLMSKFSKLEDGELTLSGDTLQFS